MLTLSIYLIPDMIKRPPRIRGRKRGRWGAGRGWKTEPGVRRKSKIFKPQTYYVLAICLHWFDLCAFPLVLPWLAGYRLRNKHLLLWTPARAAYFGSIIGKLCSCLMLHTPVNECSGIKDNSLSFTIIRYLWGSGHELNSWIDRLTCSVFHDSDSTASLFLLLWRYSSPVLGRNRWE